MLSINTYISVIITLFSNAACAPVKHRLESLDIIGFETQFYSFESYYKRPITDLSIKFDSNMHYPQLGECDTAQGVQPSIKIEPNHWFTSDDVMREQVIFHEMGHCVLNLGHDDSKLSIMNSTAISDAIYIPNRESLITSLFSY